MHGAQQFDVAKQIAEQAFENLKNALAAAGATFEHVVKLNNYLVDISHIHTYFEVRDRYVDTKAPPASTTIQISKLAHEGGHGKGAKEKGEEVTLEQVRRDFMERPDRAANILALVEDQCCWLREIGFRDVDCFWKYFELSR